jgi:hypothetical protein
MPPSALETENRRLVHAAQGAKNPVQGKRSKARSPSKERAIRLQEILTQDLEPSVARQIEQAWATHEAELSALVAGPLDGAFKRVRSGRVVVALPITAPCVGKTSIIREMKRTFEHNKSVQIVDFLDKAKVLELVGMSTALQAVIVIKSSDEFKRRMLDTHTHKSEEEVMKHTHEWFWKELNRDFEALSKFTR